jgi:hypothetical protein
VLVTACCSDLSIRAVPHVRGLARDFHHPMSQHGAASHWLQHGTTSVFGFDRSFNVGLDLSQWYINTYRMSHVSSSLVNEEWYTNNHRMCDIL